MAPQAIDAAVEVLQGDHRVLMSTVVIPLSDKKEWLDPNVVKAVLGPKGDVLYFSRAPHTLIPRMVGNAKRPTSIWAFMDTVRPGCN